MKFAKQTAALIASVIACTPLMLNSSAFFVPSTVFAESAGAAAALPDWIPNDFDSAVEFRNTYGATRIDNGLVCAVFCLKQDPVPEGEPQGMRRYELYCTDKSAKLLRHTSFGSEISSYYFEVAVFAPQQAGDFDIAFIDTWAKDIDPDLQYGHAIARYSFSAKDDMNITETDIFSWLPDGKREYSDYLSDYGEVSVHDNYVVFCTMAVDQLGDKWEPDSNNLYKNIEYLLSSDCTMQAPDMYDDGSADIIYVYQAVKDGYEKLSWVRTSDYRPDQQEPTPYVLTADCVILDDAQTVLMQNDARVTLLDYDTGEPIAVKESDGFALYEIVNTPDAMPIIAELDSNPCIVRNVSYPLDAGVGLKKPDGYSTPMIEGTHLTAEDYLTIKKYDNGAADAVFRLKRNVAGDVNDDGEFNLADLVLLHKWLLAVPDTKLVEWKAADFSNDGKLSAVDLTLMKRALLGKQTEYVKPDIDEEYGYPLEVAVDELKLFLGPDPSYPVAAAIPRGENIYERGYMQDNNFWIFTEYNGQSGWIRLYEEDNRTRTVYDLVMPAKPVIYLYPEQETDVHIDLELTESELHTTYPKYNNGWDVVAYPDGTLLNKADSTRHRYLFWDAVNCRTRFDFSTGFCIAGGDTEQFLKEKLTYMGLTEEERNEFLVYWLPLMEHNAYNLISFQGDAYTNSAKLTVTPAPGSECRIFMAYVPLENPVEFEPQQLQAFERKGFTVVEWGGVEINANH